MSKNVGTTLQEREGGKSMSYDHEFNWKLLYMYD